MPTLLYLHRFARIALLVLISSAGLALEAQAQDAAGFMELSQAAGYDPGQAWAGVAAADENCSPEETCKTLLQWSCGASFSGGPPGRDEPLVSDRPDFTEASTTVGRGVAQVEMGYTFFSNDDDGVQTRAHSYPEMLWRIGIFADWLEFRIAYNAATSDVLAPPLPRVTGSGSEDLYLGFKIGLTPQEGIFPEMALMPQMTVPTGSPAFSAGIVLPGVNWLYAWDLTERLSIGGSTQANRSLDDSGDVYLEVAQSMTVGIGLTDRLGMYTEWFVLAPSGSLVARTQHYLDGGLTFSVTNDLQLDVRAGIGLSDASDDYFVGSGLVKRF